jgi:hypothetical protein
MRDLARRDSPRTRQEPPVEAGFRRASLVRRVYGADAPPAQNTDGSQLRRAGQARRSGGRRRLEGGRRAGGRAGDEGPRAPWARRAGGRRGTGCKGRRAKAAGASLRPHDQKKGAAPTRIIPIGGGRLIQS